MPVIRAMVWNIEKLSWPKVQINGMATAIARIIVSNNADLVILLELAQNNSDNVLGALRNALQVVDPARINWFNYVWMQSDSCGNERYGFIIRDLSILRPLQHADNPNAPGAGYGSQQTPLKNLRFVRWTTWPVAFPAGPGAAPPGQRPIVPLTGPFFTPSHERRAAKKRKTSFGAQTIANGGYALGYGSRMPCLAMFAVQGAAIYYLPIVCCHYAAVRSGRNFLGQQQLSQIQQLHICQAFSFSNGMPAPAFTCDYLDIDGQATPIQNLLLTGDWNVDFLNNQDGGTNVQQTNRDSLSALTPTAQGGGSALPPAAAGAVPGGAAPAVPFAAPFAPAPDADDIAPQTLRASATTQGTMYRRWDGTNPGGGVPRGAAFDYFLYGGARPNSAVINFGVPLVDSGDVGDFAANIAQFPAAGPMPGLPNIDLGPIALDHYNAGTRDANRATRLWGHPGGALPLRTRDRWIGARMVSDHLPEVIQFNCP